MISATWKRALAFGAALPVVLALASPAAAAGIVQRIGAEFQANSIHDSWQNDPTVAGLSDGDFAVAWTDFSGKPPDSSEFLVNARKKGARETPAVATLNNRDFIVVWTDWSLLSPDKDGAGVRGQVFRVTQ